MIMGMFAFVLIIGFTAVTGFLSYSILSKVRGLLKNNVTPAAENAKATAENIRGTVAYVSETAVKPIVKAYGMGAGAKRFVGVAARFAKKKS